MKMFNCAGFVLAVLCTLIVWVNARAAACSRNEVDVGEETMPKTVCEVNQTVDRNENRIPEKLPMIKCVPCAGNCQKGYICTQLKTKILVMYKNSTSGPSSMYMYTGCVCAMEQNVKEANLVTPGTY